MASRSEARLQPQACEHELPQSLPPGPRHPKPRDAQIHQRPSIEPTMMSNSTTLGSSTRGRKPRIESTAPSPVGQIIPIQPRRTVYYQGVRYPSPDAIPIAETYPKAQKALFHPATLSANLPEIIIRRFDCATILSYKGATMVPTYETHLLGCRVSEIAQEQGRRGHFTAFDIGTGSGILAILLAQALRNNHEATVVASDIFGPALTVAELNCQLNRVRNVQFRLRDMLDPRLIQEFGFPDLLVANPPFLSRNRYSNPFAPAIAYDGGHEGIESYDTLLSQSVGRMRRDTVIGLQVQEGRMTLRRVLGRITAHLPAASIGTLRNPITHKIYGLLIGNEQLIRRYSDSVL